MFNRARIYEGPAPIRDEWPQNFLLVLAVITGVQGFHYPAWWWFPWAQFSIVWALAAAWIFVRRRSILGPKPWLVLWTVLVGLVTAHLLDDATGVGCGLYCTMGVSVGAFCFCANRRPKQTLSIVLELLGSALLLVGASMIATALISLIVPAVSTVSGLDVRWVFVFAGPPLLGLGLWLLAAANRVDRPAS